MMVASNGGPDGLDRDNAFDERRSHVRYQPPECARLGVRQHDRGPDLVEQRGAGCLVTVLCLLVRDDGFDLCGVESVEYRIPLASLVLPVARPLRVLLRLRPSPRDRVGGELKLFPAAR